MLERLPPGLAALGLLATASPALAAEKEVTAIVALACAKPEPPGLSAREQDARIRARLAEALLAQSGILASDLLSDASLSGEPDIGSRAIEMVREADLGTPTSNKIVTLRDLLELQLPELAAAPANKRKIALEGPAPLGPGWLFAGTGPGIACANREPPSDPVADFEKPIGFAAWALREKVEELSLVDKEAKKAGSARISLKRSETQKDDGSTKIATSLGVTGTLGIRLTPLSASAPVYAYGSFALSRDRTKPADPAKTQSDGDVSALETGLTVSELALGPSLVNLRAAYVSDFAHDARRAKIAATLFPGISGTLGPLCGIGSYAPLNPTKTVFARCLVTFEAEGSHVFKAGTADFKGRGEYLGLGGRLAYQLGIVTGDNMDVLANVGFRYLPTVLGHSVDVKRWDAALKYRFWTEAGIGLDFGLTYATGHEPISLANEDKIELGFGIVH
jgi:hypothetical protein